LITAASVQFALVCLGVVEPIRSTLTGSFV
jgi:hypothetical protein